ncbi:hypothetical protein [Faecalibaculum rodentium]
MRNILLSRKYPEVEYWTTFNEIYPIATNQYLLGSSRLESNMT